ARAIRWRYLFPPGSEPPGLVAANMIGYMVNNVLPLRAGELVRVYLAARRLDTRRARGTFGDNLWLAGTTLIIERVLDSIILVLLMAVLVFVIPVPRALQYAAGVMLAIDVLAAAILASLIVSPERSGRWLGR